MDSVNSTPAAIYTRISRDKVGAGLGVERQEQECRELAEKLGWSVAEVLVDNDLSASTGRRRPAYEQLLAGVAAGDYRGVLAWHTDRLHRRPAELEKFIDVVQTAGAMVQTVRAGELDLSTSSGRMVARMLGAAARAESERLGERVSSARAQSRASGRFGGGRRPFGFEADGVTLRPSEAAEIAKATEALLAGGSIRGCVLDLNARGCLTSAGATWTGRSLRGTLKRARNAGLVEHHGEIVGKAEWPAVVSEEQWRRLCQVLDDPGRRTSPGNQVKHLGSHLYWCFCGSRKVVCAAPGGTKPGKTPRPLAYRCGEEQATPGAGRHMTRNQADTDKVVVRKVLARLAEPDAKELLLPDTGDDTAAMRAELGAVRDRRASALALAADGLITDIELRSQLRTLGTQAEALESRLAAGAVASPVASLVGAKDPTVVWDSLDLGRQRAVVDSLVEVVLLPSKGSGRFDRSTVQVRFR